MGEPTWRVLAGDCLDILPTLPAESVQTCITSPPYFGLRDYGTAEWEGGVPGCDHRGVHGPGGGSDANGSWAGMGGQQHVAGAPNRGGDPSRCRCGARRIDRQIGLEPTPDEFVAALVAVFREVRRVLRDDGTLWLNLGDSYAGSWGNQGRKAERGTQRPIHGEMMTPVHDGRYPDAGSNTGKVPPGLKPKDLIGIPWMVAFALRADGWYLRSDIIWAKPNPMPESVTDRPTKAHEYLFLLAKSPRYFYDADAIREANELADTGWARTAERERVHGNGETAQDDAPAVTHRMGSITNGRNKRSVWTVTTQPFPGAHFATFPPKLIEPCVLAGGSQQACGGCGAPWQRTPMVVRPTPKRAAWQSEDDHARTQVGGTMTEPPRSETVGWQPTCGHDDDSGTSTVLDPFAGAGTTGMVALRHGRSFIGCELNPDYAEMARERIRNDGPLFNVPAERP